MCERRLLFLRVGYARFRSSKLTQGVLLAELEAFLVKEFLELTRVANLYPRAEYVLSYRLELAMFRCVWHLEVQESASATYQATRAESLLSLSGTREFTPRLELLVQEIAKLRNPLPVLSALLLL